MFGYKCVISIVRVDFRTGRRVLSQEERLERRRIEAAEAQAQLQAQAQVQTPITPAYAQGQNPYARFDRKQAQSGGPDQTFMVQGSEALNSFDPADRRPSPSHHHRQPSPQSARPHTITAPPPYGNPVARSSPRSRSRAGTASAMTPTNVRPSGDYVPDLKPGSAMATAAQADRIIDKLEDVSIISET